MHRWTTALAMLAVTTPAVAQDGEPGGADRRYLGTRHHLAVELDFGHGSEDGITVFGMQPIISGRYAVTPLLGLEATFPFTFVSISDEEESESDFSVGNICLGVDYRALVGRDQNLSLAFTLGLPTASIDDDDLATALKQLLNYGSAFASRGFHRAWLFLPENLSLVPEVRWIGYSGALYTKAQVALPVFIETSDQDDEVDLALDVMGRVGYDFGPVVPFLGLSAVVWLTSGDFSDDDDAQLGLDLGVIVDISRSVVFEAAVHLNLDDPFDSFDDEGIIGFYVDAVFEL